MRLLWVKSDFLHPTTRGGQIRTLEMLRRLHKRHEIHYMGYHAPGENEGVERSSEYCSKAWPVCRRIPNRRSPTFAWQLLAGLVSELPVSIRNYRSNAMANLYQKVTQEIAFDSIVCDFPIPAPNICDLSRCVLFQHNVEWMIWRRHAENGATALHRAYFALQARRMREFERALCRKVRRVIAVSEADAELMTQDFGVAGIEPVPTGVDLEYFKAPEEVRHDVDITFVGSMDWLPNEDGVLWFSREILPRIRIAEPEARLTIVGRSPSSAVKALMNGDARTQVTGTVADVRPYLWGSKIAIVPLRIGGGTRLKIYEAMAVGVPVVSTGVGAEGLEVVPGRHILIANDPAAFADACISLLRAPERRAELAAEAHRHVSEHYSWDAVTAVFERMLFS